MITPTLIKKLNWQAYFIFMCTNLAFIPLVYYCYPETTNLTLEEVDYLFVKEGRKGFFNKFKGPSQPVLESFKEQHWRRESLRGGGDGVVGTMERHEREIEKTVAGAKGLGDGDSGEAQHVEGVDEGKDDKSL